LFVTQHLLIAAATAISLFCCKIKDFCMVCLYVCYSSVCKSVGARAGHKVHAINVVQGCGYKEYSGSSIIMARCSALSALTSLDINSAALCSLASADVIGQGRIALPSLRALSLPELDLDFRNAQALSKSLCNMTQLTRLEVSQAIMPTSAVLALARTIASMRSLLHLGFMMWCVGNEGAKAVGEALATIPALSTVRMTECEISETGAYALLHAFTSSKVCELYSLDLRGNPIKQLTGTYAFLVHVGDLAKTHCVPVYIR
jgi:hypothetical protein